MSVFSYENIQKKLHNQKETDQFVLSIYSSAESSGLLKWNL